MIIRCPNCQKMRKYGVWINPPEWLREEIKKIPSLDIKCPECEKCCPHTKIIEKIPTMNMLVQGLSWGIALLIAMDIVGFTLWGLGIL